MASLDRQEEVHINRYRPLTKEVLTPDGKLLTCRTYEMVNPPTEPVDLTDPNRPVERIPSKSAYQIQYKNTFNRVIIKSQSLFWVIC